MFGRRGEPRRPVHFASDSASNDGEQVIDRLMIGGVEESGWHPPAGTSGG